MVRVDVINYVGSTKEQTKAQSRMDQQSGSWAEAELILKPSVTCFEFFLLQFIE